MADDRASKTGVIGANRQTSRSHLQADGRWATRIRPRQQIQPRMEQCRAARTGEEHHHEFLEAGPPGTHFLGSMLAG